VDEAVIGAIETTRSVSARVTGEGSIFDAIKAGEWDDAVAKEDQQQMATMIRGLHEYLLQLRRTLDSFRQPTDSPALYAAKQAAQTRLPFNRKERYFTGTVLPSIISADGFRHLGLFLQLCGLPDDLVQPGLEGDQDLQFFTEYNFAESVQRNDQRWANSPIGGDTPDVVLAGRDWLLAVEAKMYDRPHRNVLTEQIRRQRDLITYWTDTLGLDPARVRHVLLVPEALTVTAAGLADDVVIWQAVHSAYRHVGPAYWVGILEYALAAYEELAAPAERSFGANKDGTRTGQQIAAGDVTDPSGRPFTWMGRTGGLFGTALQDDINSEAWRSRRYEVRYDPLPTNPNWFAINDFLNRVQAPPSVS
jgi:hypothetical protein